MLLLMPAVAGAQATSLDELPWEFGPAKGQVGSIATIDVPEGYAFLGPDGAREFNRLTQNPSPGIDEYVLAKDDLSWTAFFSFNPVGYVRDDEKLDPAAMLETVSEGTEAANEERRRNGWDPLHVVGWAFEPQYDASIKSLEWAFRLRSDGSADESINYNTRILGRRGVAEVLLVTSPELMQTSVADFKTKLPGFTFKPGESYAEFKDGDHVAAYGLAALVTGGAAAVASKKGLFAALAVFLVKAWKLVLVGVLALGAGVRSVFRKKERTPPV